MKNKGKDTITISAVFSKEEDGGYSVSVPLVPGCVSQGDTLEEALANIKEALELHLEDDSQEEIRLLREHHARAEFLVPVAVHA